MKPATTCPICSKVRGLSEHLIELSDAALLLGNKSQFTNEHGKVLIRTETIGDWLRLAAQLDEVKISSIRNKQREFRLECQSRRSTHCETLR